MTAESLQWLRTNILIGNTTQRGNAWWAKRADGEQPNHFPGPVPINAVRSRLFNFQAIELPVAVVEPATLETMTNFDASGSPVRHRVLENRKAIATSDTHDVLGIFRDGYKPHQLDEWLLEGVAQILDNGLSISSAGLLRGRSVAWVEVSVPETLTTKEGFDYRPNLLATTSFDGTIATTFKRTVTATVCDNTHSIAMSERGQTVKFRHSKNSMTRIADARSALNIVEQMADDFAAQVTALTSQVVTDKQWSEILDKLVPNTPDSKRGQAFANTKREQLTELYRNDERCSPWNGTAFGVVQTFSTWSEHVQATKGDTIRAERNMMNALNGTAEAQSIATLTALGLVTPSRAAVRGIEQSLTI